MRRPSRRGRVESLIDALRRTRLVPPLLSYPQLPPRYAVTSTESLPASTRISLSPGASHSRATGPTPAEGEFAPRAASRQQPAVSIPLSSAPAAYSHHYTQPSPQSPPALEPPPRLYLASQTLRRLAELNTPAKNIYIQKHTYTCLPTKPHRLRM